MRNVFVVFLVSGLWHGANWTFILWGIIHACLFLPLLMIGASRRRATEVVAEGRSLPTFREAVQMLATFLLVVFAWIPFRAPDVGTAIKYIGGIFSPSLFEPPQFALSMFPWLTVLVTVEWIRRHKPHPLWLAGNAIDGKAWLHLLRMALYMAIAVVCAAHKASNSEFIYFQF